MTSWTLALGATLQDDGVTFRVWAPDRRRVDVVVYVDTQPDQVHPLTRDSRGYWSGHVAGLGAGTRYMYRLDGSTDRPDPASRHQPRGVHGPSRVVDPHFTWSDSGWRGVPRDGLVVYELHVGTATQTGTFEALIEHLPDLRRLGVTAIELMPIADFPGGRNWGYDGVDLFAPANVYGGPEGLKRLVDAAHGHGLAVLLDVVYNHFGPSGNYLRDFASSYFTNRHHTPWGDAINYDGPDSHAVRDFAISNALYWAHEYHIDGLRLDATHAIVDDSPRHVLQELGERVRASLPADRHFLLIAEDERSDVRLLRRMEAGGWGMDAVWADDFHHSLRVTLTGEREGYYQDYSGGAHELAQTLRGGWLYQGQVSPRTGAPRGTAAHDQLPAGFVYCIQNHDQVGNRALGTRLNHDVEPAAYRMASALLVLAPQTPMLFMGQEWAASTPFLFFTDHEPELGRLVTEGRRSEFKHFAAFTSSEIPDPQAEATFLCSKLRWEERGASPHAPMLALYTDLLALRRRHPAFHNQTGDGFDVHAISANTLLLRRSSAQSSVVVVVNVRGVLDLALSTVMEQGHGWHTLLDTEDEQYGGVGQWSANITPPGESAAGYRPRLDGPRAIVFGTNA